MNLVAGVGDAIQLVIGSHSFRRSRIYYNQDQPLQSGSVSITLSGNRRFPFTFFQRCFYSSFIEKSSLIKRKPNDYFPTTLFSGPRPQTLWQAWDLKNGPNHPVFQGPTQTQLPLYAYPEFTWLKDNFPFSDGMECGKEDSCKNFHDQYAYQVTLFTLQTKQKREASPVWALPFFNGQTNILL